MKKTYILLRSRKGSVGAVVLKGKYPNGMIAFFKSESAARKIQKKFRQFAVYSVERV